MFNFFGGRGWIQTFSGVEYYPSRPSVTKVRIIDIAHALSNLCRYSGHTRRFYSVAEHSVLVSQIVPPEHALCGLLHDATETYLSDISKPLKYHWLMWGYRVLERRNWVVIADKFGLPRTMPEAVHAADYAMLRAEQVRLMPYCDLTETWSRDAAAGVLIQGWLPAEAETRFLERFYELTRGRPLPVKKVYAIGDSGWQVRVRGLRA